VRRERSALGHFLKCSMLNVVRHDFLPHSKDSSCNIANSNEIEATVLA